MHLRALVIERRLSVQKWRYKSGGRSERRSEKHLPFFEFLPMGIIFDAADHEVGQVAILMRYHVEETVLRFLSARFDNNVLGIDMTFVVNDFLSQLDGGVMTMGDVRS